MFKGVVLVVDDQTEIVDLITEALTRKKIKSLASSDGREAGNLVQNQQFAAIILDLKLPNLNGLQVAAYARAHKANRNTPIFIVSGHVERDSLERIQKLGVAHVITKPFQINQLIHRMMETVANRPKPLEYDTRIVKAFVSAARDIIQFYFGKVPVVGAPQVKENGTPRNVYATAIIPITGNQISGSMALGLSVVFVKHFLDKLLGSGEMKVDGELISSTMGEMCNQILGKVSQNLRELGIEINIGLPSVVMGRGHKVVHKVNNNVLVIPMRLDNMVCELEFCLGRLDLKANLEVEFEEDDDQEDEAEAQAS